MKLAISNIAWPVEHDAEVAELLRAHGFTGVELAPTKYWPDFVASDSELARVRAFWNDRGLEVVAMQALLFGKPELHVFGESRDRLLEHLRVINRIGQGLGARALVFGSPKNRKREGRDESIAVEFFRRAGEDAARAGLCLCIEPNPPQYECDFVTTLRDARALVQKVDHPGFGLHGDLGQLTMTGESLDEILASRGMLQHFHASEPNLAPVGDGPHVEAAKTLRAIDYDRWVSIEMRATPTFDLEVLRRALVAVAGAYG